MSDVRLTETRLPFGGGYLYRIYVDDEKYSQFVTNVENRLTPDEMKWSEASYNRAINNI